MANETFGKKVNRLRKQTGMTQRELAGILGISEPAVCKWETDSSMPDIMLLVPLARALHTDLNTLFSYEENISSERVKELVDTAGEIGLEEGTERELAYWRNVLQEYPNSEHLKLEYVRKLTKLQMQGEISEEQMSVAEPLLLELTESVNEELREPARLYLVSFYIRSKRFGEAEELISTLSPFDFNARHMKALLLYETKDYTAGLMESEQFLFECVQNALICLSHMATIASVPGDKEKECFYAETMCRLEEMFGVPFYRGETSMINYYIRQKEYEKAVECFERYVERMLCAEDILKESRFFAEVNPEIKFISNGSFVSLEEFREELWKVMQTPGYMSKIRDDERVKAGYKKLQQYLNEG